MSRTYRDSQRRLDNQADRVWRKHYNNGSGTVTWGDRIWRNIVRYSQGRRKYFAGIKHMKRHLLKENRMHNYIYGHHNWELEQ